MSADDYAAYCVELLAVLGPARARRMFGGHGLYLDDRMVGLVADERLYLKVDAQTRPAFEAAGGEPFVYEAKEKTATMSYWTPPEEAMDSAEAMRPWAMLALEAALRQPAPKVKAKRAPKAPRGRR